MNDVGHGRPVNRPLSGARPFCEPRVLLRVRLRLTIFCTRLLGEGLGYQISSGSAECHPLLSDIQFSTQPHPDEVLGRDRGAIVTASPEGSVLAEVQASCVRSTAPRVIEVLDALVGDSPDAPRRIVLQQAVADHGVASKPRGAIPAGHAGALQGRPVLRRQ